MNWLTTPTGDNEQAEHGSKSRTHTHTHTRDTPYYSSRSGDNKQRAARSCVRDDDVNIRSSPNRNRAPLRTVIEVY